MWLTNPHLRYKFLLQFCTDLELEKMNSTWQSLVSMYLNILYFVEMWKIGDTVLFIEFVGYLSDFPSMTQEQKVFLEYLKQSTNLNFVFALFEEASFMLYLLFNLNDRILSLKTVLSTVTVWFGTYGKILDSRGTRNRCQSFGCSYSSSYKLVLTVSTESPQYPRFESNYRHCKLSRYVFSINLLETVSWLNF